MVTPEKAGLDHGEAMEWRASRLPNGNPGADDRISYATWATNWPGLGAATADDDNDGLTNFMEFSLGSNPTVSSPEAPPTAAQAADRFQLTFTYAPVNGGHTRTVEFTDSLGAWTATGTLINRITLPDGRFTDTWQSPCPSTPPTSASSAACA